MLYDHCRADVGVLGAGIMGCCLALELAQQGFNIDLIDQAPAPMQGASLHNEGKLHLGFVYAKDPSRTSHLLMLRGSLAFSRILERLTGCSAAEFLPSQPFYYFIPRDSQLALNEIHDYFQVVDEDIQDEIQRSGDSYLGRKITRFFELNSRDVHANLFSPDQTLGSFRTEEVSVSPAAVADILTQAVKDHHNIQFIGNTEILGAELLNAGEIRIDYQHKKTISSMIYSCVANCLWDGKLNIDRSIGFPDTGAWISRYKATINLSVPVINTNNIPSATGILGSYGDVVNHGNGQYYLSWYPLCKMAQSVNQDGRLLHDQIHPAAFSRFLQKATLKFPSISKSLASMIHQDFFIENLSALAAFIPALEDLLDKRSTFELGGGVILARGSSDIDDPESYLHQRSEIGPTVFHNYLSIDTGKYCTAPMFAVQAAEMIKKILS